MHPVAKSILFAIVSVVLFAGCAFFAYYTVRLIYVNFAAADISQNRQHGMFIGAVAFPVISLTLGYLGFRCAKASRTR
jgi:ABC-type microcin C transport system permease subunit YejB